MHLPKGTTVYIGRHVYKDEIPDKVAEQHKIVLSSTKKPKKSSESSGNK